MKLTVYVEPQEVEAEISVDDIMQELRSKANWHDKVNAAWAILRAISDDEIDAVGPTLRRALRDALVEQAERWGR